MGKVLLYNDELTSHEVSVRGPTWTVQLDSKVAHILSWTAPSAREGLPDCGGCNLYSYPSVMSADVPTGSIPSAEAVDVLDEILKWLCRNAPEALEIPDEVGAYPIHALMVANTRGSLRVAQALYDILPSMLTWAHADSGPYAGETALHVAAVNHGERLLLRLLDTAKRRLSASELKGLLSARAKGEFFRAWPTCHFGGTVLSFACCFGLRQAVLALLDTELVSLNRREHSCSISGFLPLHAVVACGTPSQLEMYDFLTSELPTHRRASTSERTSHTRDFGYTNLMPIQLAAALGHQGMVRHALRKQSEVMWEWGPVSQFALDLAGIDSSGSGGGDLMELVVAAGAKQGCREMILDSFLNGFLYTLYQEKWKLYGRKLFSIELLTDGILLGSLAAQTFALKSDPGCLPDVAPLSYFHLVVSLMSSCLEAWVIMLYWRNMQGKGDTRMDSRSMAHHVYGFVRDHGILFLVLAHLLIVVGSVLIISDTLPHPACAHINSSWLPRSVGHADHTPEMAAQADLQCQQGFAGGSPPDGSPPDDFAGSQRRALRSSISSGDLMNLRDFQIARERVWPLLWLVHGVALLLLGTHFAVLLSRPFMGLSVLMTTMNKVLMQDLATFLAAFSLLILVLYPPLYTLYPRAGEHGLPHVDSFNSWYESLQAMIDLGLLAQSVRIDMLWEATDAMSELQIADLFLWAIGYYIFLILSCILMLNLLIATLTHTYDEVCSEATLQSRLQLATVICKMELVATALGMPTHAGELTSAGTYVHRWISVDEATIHSDRGGHQQDPFAPPKPSPLELLQQTVNKIDERTQGLPRMQEPNGQRDTSEVEVVTDLEDTDTNAVEPIAQL